MSTRQTNRQSSQGDSTYIFTLCRKNLGFVQSRNKSTSSSSFFEQIDNIIQTNWIHLYIIWAEHKARSVIINQVLYNLYVSIILLNAYRLGLVGKWMPIIHKISSIFPFSFQRIQHSNKKKCIFSSWKITRQYILCIPSISIPSFQSIIYP